MRKLLIFIGLFLTFGLSGQVLPGVVDSQGSTNILTNIYYVSTSGDNGNTGLTQGDPWQTLAYAETNATNPGDIIALKKGDTWSSTTALAIKHGGTNGYHIVWDGSLWGSGANAIIQSSADRSNGNDAIVNIITCNYLTFQKITVDGNDKACYGLIIGGHSGFSGNNQIVGLSESYIRIKDLSITDCGDSGDDYRNALQVNPYLGDCDSITIMRCSISGATNHTFAIYPEADYNHRAATNIYIGYNTLTNYGLKKNGVAAGIMIVNQVTNCVIEHNTVIGTAAGDGFGMDIDCNEVTAGHYPTGIIVRYNDVKVPDVVGYPCFGVSANETGVTMLMSVDVYYNKFYSAYSGYSDGGGIWIFEGSGSLAGSTLRFFNNTIVTEGGTSIKDESNRAGILTIKNNIFLNRGTVGDGDNRALRTSNATITHSNNAYYKTDNPTTYILTRTASTERTAAQTVTWEGTAIVIDPLLVDVSGFNWHLQAGSTCKTAGVTIAGLPLFDYEGNAVSATTPSIGAYEYH